MSFKPKKGDNEIMLEYSYNRIKNENNSLKDENQHLKVENQRLKAENKIHNRINRTYSNNVTYFPDCFKYGFGFGKYAPIWFPFIWDRKG